VATLPAEPWPCGLPAVTAFLPTFPAPRVKIAVTAAISLAGVLDLGSAEASGVGGDAVARLLGGSQAEVPERYRMASLAALVPLGVPQALINGLADTTVPPSMSEAYARAAREAGDDARYFALPGIGHREVIDPWGPPWEQAMIQLESAFGR